MFPVSILPRKIDIYFFFRNAFDFKWMQYVYSWEEYSLIRAALANSGFSFFVSARGCTRITLNVTRLSGAHAASKLSPVYNCAVCARMRSVFSVWRTTQRNQRRTERRYTACRRICEIILHLYCRHAYRPLRSVNRIMNKYLLHYIEMIERRLC